MRSVTVSRAARRLLIMLVVGVIAGSAASGAEPSRGPAKRGAAPVPSPADSAPGLDVSRVIEEVRHHVAPNGPDALRAQENLYRADFTPAGFSMTLRDGDRGGDDDGFARSAAATFSTATVRRGSSVTPALQAPWTASRNTALRIVAPGVTERVTAKDRRIKWDYVLEAKAAGDVEIGAALTAAGTPAVDPRGVLRVPSVAGRSVLIGELVVLDARGRTLHRAKPVFRDGMLRLRVPAGALQNAVYPVTLDPEVGPEYGPADSVLLASGGSTPVTAWSGSRWLVVWSDLRSASATDEDIYAARIEPSGVVLDQSGIAVTRAPGRQMMPDVTWNGSNFLVVWSNESSLPGSIFGARVSAAGAVLDPTPFPISSFYGARPRVATVGGTSLVVFETGTYPSTDVVGVRVSATGAVLDTYPFTVAPTAGYTGLPTIAASGSGFLVAWEQDVSNVLQIHAARVTTAAVVSDPSGFALTSGGSGYRVAPDATFNGTNFAVAWYSAVGIFVARVSPAGSVLDPGGDLVVSSTGTIVVEQPAIAATGASFVLAYERAEFSLLGLEYREGGVQRLNSDLSLSGSQLLVGMSVRSPDLAYDGTNTLVTWEAFRIQATRISAAGSNLDGAITVSKRPAAQADPQIAWDGTIFLVVWRESEESTEGNVRGARVSSSGTVLDPAGLPIAPGVTNEGSPDVAWDGANFLVVWAQTSSVNANRVTPAGAILDGAGFTLVGDDIDRFGDPTVVRGSTGTLVVLERVRSFQFDVVAVRVSGNTVQDARPFEIAMGSQSESEASVAFDGTNYLVAWWEIRGATPDVYAARVTPSGTVLDAGGFPVAASSTSEMRPVVAAGGAGFLVAWEDDSTDRVSARRVTSSGLPAGPAFRLSSSGDLEDAPAAAWNGNTFVVAWQSRQTVAGAHNILAARVSTAGEILDTTPLAVANTAEDEERPSIVPGVTDRVAISYSRFSSQHRSTRVFLRHLDDPQNDAFASPRLMPALSGAVTGVTAGATKEWGEPNHAGNAGGASTWFVWHASSGGTLTVDTLNSNFDTTLAAYTGTQVDALTLLAQDDDGGPARTSRVVVPVRRGATYRIAVDGYGGAKGEVRLQWSLTEDTLAPQTTIDSGPSGSVGQTYATFTFSSSEAASTFECSLDNASFERCVSPATYPDVVPGAHTFAVRATDTAGNTDASPATRTWTVDAVAPDTVIGSGPLGTVGSSDATFTFTSDDATATFQCQLDGAGFTACSSPQTYSNLSAGNHSFAVRARDAAGNVDQTPATRSWTVDITAPDTTIDSGPPAATTSSSASFTFSASEAGASFACSIDGGAYAPCSSPASYAALPEGSHTFGVRASDSVGNADATPATRTWTIDTTAPDTTITGGPSGATGSSTVSFTFTSAEPGATFTCSLDSAPFAACTSPAAYSGIADGSHTFTVRAHDAAGNIDATPASRSFVVDTAAPVTTIDSAPSGTVSSTSATIAFRSSEAGTTECSLDGAAFTACSSPATYTGLGQGSHTVRVRSRDVAGNLEAAPPSRTWIVDTVAPDTSVTAGPAGVTNSRSANIGFSSAEDGATFQCSLDGAPYGACASPVTYSNLTDGSHVFLVRAVDAGGNVDATPASLSWTVDTAAPDTTITSGPGGTVASDGVTITFSGSEPGSSFACSLDGAAYAACSSPFTRAGLADGPHTFAVRATDPAGNTDATPASAAWTVDTTAPDTTITGGPSGLVATQSVTFTFTAEAGATFACRIDTGVFAACTSPASYTLSDGAHTFEVRAGDAAGNADATPASRSFTIDSTPPATTLQSGPSGTVSSTSASFGFTADESATFACSLDGAAYAACTSPFAYSSLAQGQHTFRVQATDAAGNTDATPESRTWTVDTTAPQTSITGGPASPTKSTNATFTFTSDDAGATFRCRLDDAAFAACTSPVTLASVPEGAHTFEVIALDAVGNADATAASYAWRIDLTAPNTTITAGPTGTAGSTSATFTFTSSEAGSMFECRLDGAVWASCAPPTTVDGLLDGAHTFEVRATDPAANTDGSPASRAWTVDTRAPATTITSGPSGPVSSTSATFTFTSDEAGSFRCSLDGAAFSVCSSPASYASLAEGPHTFRVKAVDTAGNEDATPAQRDFGVDVSPPAVAITRPTGGVWFNDQLILPAGQTLVAGAITVNATATDSGGVVTFQFEVDGAPVPASQVAFDPGTSTYSFVYRPAAGMHTVVARATNAAGLSRTASVSLIGLA